LSLPQFHLPIFVSIPVLSQNVVFLVFRVFGHFPAPPANLSVRSLSFTQLPTILVSGSRN